MLNEILGLHNKPRLRCIRCNKLTGSKMKKKKKKEEEEKVEKKKKEKVEEEEEKKKKKKKKKGCFFLHMYITMHGSENVKFCVTLYNFKPFAALLTCVSA